MLQVVIMFVFALMISVSAWAGNWNKTNNETQAAYEFIKIEGQIPLTRKYDLMPTKSDILLTDTSTYEYPNCLDSIKTITINTHLTLTQC
jgi:hypothetical protein